MPNIVMIALVALGAYILFKMTKGAIKVVILAVAGFLLLRMGLTSIQLIGAMLAIGGFFFAPFKKLKLVSVIVGLVLVFIPIPF